MTRFTRLALTTIVLFSVCACSKEEPNPELRDPIYDDLQKRAAEHLKNNEASLASLKSQRESLEKAEANSIEKKQIQKDIAKSEAAVLDSGQWAHYYKIRAERRRLVDKLSYKEAFAAKKEWPDPHEYSDYLVNRRLVEVSRNWNLRIPKLTDRLPSSKPAAAKGEAKGAEKKGEE